MRFEDGERLLGLGAAALVAVGAVIWLLRLSARQQARPGPIMVGYPVDLFPATGLTREGPLATLAATQARLVAIYTHMPPQSDSAIWLQTFLRELREIMDTAYHA